MNNEPIGGTVLNEDDGFGVLPATGGAAVLDSLPHAEDEALVADAPTIAAIFKDPTIRHDLSLFEDADIAAIEALLEKKNGKTSIKCLATGKERAAKPEEIVRQLWIRRLLTKYNYPKQRLAIEFPITFGRDTSKRADIVVFDAHRSQTPYIIVEVKKTKLKDGKDQLKSYCHATGAPLGVWSDGGRVSVYNRRNPNYFSELPDLPASTQDIEEIVNEPWTIETLVAKEATRERTKSLKQIILEMEDEVLSNAGVDVFEEVFKLIFTKLYDELSCFQGKTKHLRFRNTNTETELSTRIDNLFREAREKWEGVFSFDDRIRLTGSHLVVCVSYLEEFKLFNSNLDIVDEAFEYLINQNSKGEKGQYFTPRWVIDMCVKMLNPQEDESLIDTACGSAGFTMHAIFKVWNDILHSEGLEQSHLFTLERKPHRCYEYVRERVFGLDFDEKAVRVARCLNLIAGDGQTNVLHLNTLDWTRWAETVKNDAWNDTYNEGWKKLRKLAVKDKDYRAFKFDLLMANPPFAGDIKQSDMLTPYDLAHKANGKTETKVGRDLLFIERNLDFLKPGGRMAVVLPQGRFNNSSDKRLREFIAERCRILAVVGLESNTFKPHTGTKTSVLFVQKWNDDVEAGAVCPRVDDYPIFFATQQLAAKDSSGEKLVAQKDGEYLKDSHGHYIVRHDLFNHDGKTQDGIAEAFIEFAKREELSFF